MNLLSRTCRAALAFLSLAVLLGLPEAAWSGPSCQTPWAGSKESTYKGKTICLIGAPDGLTEEQCPKTQAQKDGLPAAAEVAPWGKVCIYGKVYFAPQGAEDYRFLARPITAPAPRQGCDDPRFSAPGAYKTTYKGLPLCVCPPDTSTCPKIQEASCLTLTGAHPFQSTGVGVPVLYDVPGLPAMAGSHPSKVCIYLNRPANATYWGPAQYWARRIIYTAPACPPKSQKTTVNGADFCCTSPNDGAIGAGTSNFCCTKMGGRTK